MTGNTNKKLSRPESNVNEAYTTLHGYRGPELQFIAMSRALYSFEGGYSPAGDTVSVYQTSLTGWVKNKVKYNVI